MTSRTWSVLIAAALVIGLSPVADAGGYGSGYHGHGHHKRFQHRFDRYARHSHHRYARHSNHRYRHHSHGRYRHHRGGYVHAGGDLAIGLFAGTLFGYAIASSYEPYYYHRRPVYREYHYYGPPRVIYHEPAPRVVYVEPRPAAQPTAGECVQRREYQTVITIGGEQVPAWGIACLQPDGTWRRPGVSIVPPG